ncbi:MAG: hypothetical protein AB1426_08220 [Bacillota bacterium]
MRGKGLLVMWLCLVLLSLPVSYALAGGGALYSVVARDASTLGQSATGTHGHNYVMSDPAVVLGSFHVSSLYVDHNGTGYNFAEVGWCVHRTLLGRSLYAFCAYSLDGNYTHRHYGGLISYNSNHDWTVRHYSGTYWRWYLDGSELATVDLKGKFTYGYSLASSERNNSGDTNYSHFWGLQDRNSSGVWYSWSNLSQWKDNDPDYRLNKVSNTECYMQL